MLIISDHRCTGRTTKLCNAAIEDPKSLVIVSNCAMRHYVESKFPLLKNRVISERQLDRVRGHSYNVYVDNADYMKQGTLDCLRATTIAAITVEAK